MTDHISPAPFTEDQPWTLYVGDARTVLAGMPGQSADCIVTSPPYWGKRDYGVPGQYGHEDSPAAYVDTMRDVFREARRVLADEGTCWLNLGDSYSASAGGATGMHAYLGEHITTHRATGIHAKNACQLSRPNAAIDATASAAAVRLAAISTLHRRSARRTSGNSRPNCGL